LSKIHHGHDRPAIGSQYLAPPIEELPADYAGDSAERDRANQEVSSTPRHSRPAGMWQSYSRSWVFGTFDHVGTCYCRTRAPLSNPK